MFASIESSCCPKPFAPSEDVPTGQRGNCLMLSPSAEGGEAAGLFHPPSNVTPGPVSTAVPNTPPGRSCTLFIIHPCLRYALRSTHAMRLHGKACVRQKNACTMSDTQLTMIARLSERLI